jgi:hypothetical protein
VALLYSTTKPGIYPIILSLLIVQVYGRRHFSGSEDHHEIDMTFVTVAFEARLCNAFPEEIKNKG